MSFTRVGSRLCAHARNLSSLPAMGNAVRSKELLITAGVCTMCGAALTGKYLLDKRPSNLGTGRLLSQMQLQAATPEEDSEHEEKTIPDVYQHARERRFHEFASIEVDGELYMTAQDFLESVTDEDPRPRLSVRKVSKEDLRRMLKKTPNRSSASPNLFRRIHETGIISYSEYLFLLCILTKPKAGFKIAFKMFDTDGNERVDKKEFLVLEEIFRNKTEKSTVAHKESRRKDKAPEMCPLTDLKTLLSKKQDDEVQDTSLLVHFFGERGNKTLSFEDFYQFMDNLQTEVLELEFMEYSRGMPTISEEEFARVLLRYTDILNEEEYYKKLRARIPEEKGLSFDEFRSFFQFLNNLEDFAISVNMYLIAGRPIGQDEFHRAVKVTTGHDLSQHLVHTLFQLFDKDGDGKLSYVEFIGVMKDRLHRGFRSHLMKHVGWSGYKKCIKHNIKASKASS